MSEQTSQPINADDPGLTAYALGELEGSDAARYATAVAASAELQAIVAEIQAEARVLSNQLRLEPQVPMPAERRAEILSQANAAQPIGVAQRKRLLGISRRTAAVAASVLLMPAAWYAFGAAFPRMRTLPIFAYQETTSKEFYNESAPQAALMSRPGPMVNGPGPGLMEPLKEFSLATDTVANGDDANSVYDPAIRETGVLFGARGVESAKSAFDAKSTSQRVNKKGAPLGWAKPQLAWDESGVTTKSPQTERQYQSGGKLEQEFESAESTAPESGKRRGFLKDQKPGQSQAAGDPRMAGRISKRTTFSAYDADRGRPGAESTLSLGDQSVSGNESGGPSKAAEAKRNSPSGKEKEKRRLASLGYLAGRSIERKVDKKADVYLGVPSLAELRSLEQDKTTDEDYNPIFENAFITPQEQQLSTFSIDVDTASYSNLRRFLQGGQLPPPDAVRIEELVNYFAYQYPQPQDGRPFSVQTDIAACPWQPNHQLVRIGLKGKEIPKEQRSPTNLVFLIDVSGSMQAQNKLPLVRESLTTLVNQLDERDKVAIVTYAGDAGVRLASTSVAQKEVILTAIAGLGAGGSTNGAAGINTAYDIAAQEFLDKGTNRVILCTDGDFNVGVTSDDALVQMIQTRAKGGVFLSIFGFGMGNLKDAKLEQLADKGNGQYGYIDDQQEANKVFVQELMGTLVTIAKDVKIQIDFNKDVVASYRLVGYENRVMAAEDFHDDKKDAGEIGAGHTVTALYEIIPTKDFKANNETRWLTVKLRYKQPEASVSVLMENPLVGQPGQLKLASSDFQFAASVAACGMLLRHSQYAGQSNWGLVKELAQSGLSHDPHGHRRAFLGLVGQAESLMGQLSPSPPRATDSTAGGRYKSLLRRLHVPADSEKYGQFNDYGHSDMKTYAGTENLPEGYWVYVAPYWYIWAETTQKAAK